MGPPAKELLLRGTASIEIVDGVPAEYLTAAAKSTQGDELAAFEAAKDDYSAIMLKAIEEVIRNTARIFFMGF